MRSDGTHIRDYVHVDDVVSGYMKLAKVSQEKELDGEAFNFSRNEPLSVKALYEFICKATVGNYVEPKILNTAKSEIKDQHLNSAKAETVLGWSSSVPIAEGLSKTVDWYRSYLHGNLNI